MLIASHDRSFLDACTTRTLFLRPGVSCLYAHPYTAARALLASDDTAQDRRHAKDSKEATRLRRSASELRNVGINSGSDALQKKSMLLRDRAERLEATLRPSHVERSGAIRLASRNTHAKILAALCDLVVAAPDGRGLFSIAKLDIRQGDRLVLLGRNGVGKSQLIRLLRRATIEPVLGVQISPSLVVGYADQGMAHLPDKLTPHRFIASRPGIGDGRATSPAGRGRHRHRGAGQPDSPALTRPNERGSDCSGFDWRSRTSTCSTSPPTTLTSPAEEKLEAELLAQSATCVVVSHDRSFVTAIGTRFLAIENGQAKEVEG